MKTFKFGHGRISEGLKTFEDSKFGPVVEVGEEGRGRHLKKVGLLRQDPPSINEKKEIQNAAAVKITNRRTGQQFSLLKKSKTNEERILVLISSNEGYKRHCHGKISFLQGGDKPENLIAEGHGAYGDAGRTGYFEEKLIILEKGDVLKVDTTKYNTWFIAYIEETPEVFSKEDWELKEAVEETEIQIQEI